MAEIVNTEQ